MSGLLDKLLTVLLCTVQLLKDVSPVDDGVKDGVREADRASRSEVAAEG